MSKAEFVTLVNFKVPSGKKTTPTSSSSGEDPLPRRPERVPEPQPGQQLRVHPREVREPVPRAGDCVTLQMVTADKVVFCVTEEEDNVYNMKVGKGKGNFVQNVLVFHSCTSFKKKKLTVHIVLESSQPILVSLGAHSLSVATLVAVSVGVDIWVDLRFLYH